MLCVGAFALTLLDGRTVAPRHRRDAARPPPARWRGAWAAAVDATPRSQAQEKEEDEREARRKAREEMEMKAFLEDKDEAFAEAHQRALEWTDDFAIYAEKKCVETLQRVQREAQAHYDRQLLRQSLRLIRLPWAEKRAIALMNRQKMRNLLRLCAGCGLGVRIPSCRSRRRDAIDATLTGLHTGGGRWTGLCRSTGG